MTIPLSVGPVGADWRDRLLLFLMIGVPLAIWARLVIWLVIGLAIYWGYGRSHSTLAAPRAVSTSSAYRSAQLMGPRSAFPFLFQALGHPPATNISL